MVSDNEPFVNKNDLLVGVVKHTKVIAWPPKPGKSPGVMTYGPLAEMLMHEFSCDSHFAQYAAPSVPHRLRVGAERLIPDGVQMVMLALDVDYPKQLRVDGAAPDAWWEAERVKVDRLLADERAYCFRTRGGYRLLGWLPQPFYITDARLAHYWSETYVLACAHLDLRYGIRPDPACRDWQHLQRCPLAMRDVGGKLVREPGIAVGDPHKIGAWRLSGFDEQACRDHVRALAADSKAWRAAHSMLTRTENPPALTSPRAIIDVDLDPITASLVEPISQIPVGGGRHAGYKALSGALLDRGVSPDVLPALIERISVAAGVDDEAETRDRVAAAETTVNRHAAGERYTRIGTLNEHWPTVAAALDEVLPPPACEAIAAVFSRTSTPPKLSAGEAAGAIRSLLDELDAC